MDARIATAPAPATAVISPDELKAEVIAWVGRIGAEPREVHIRAMSRKWASCSSAGRLTFSTSLLEQTREFRNEVIAHEVLHLKIPNHGKLFRRLLKAHVRGAPGHAREP